MYVIVNLSWIFSTGKFGNVYKAQLRRDLGTVTVAVKTVKKYKSQKDTDDFQREMNMMLQMIHPNIVQIYGLVQEGIKSNIGLIEVISILWLTCRSPINGDGIFAVW